MNQRIRSRVFWGWDDDFMGHNEDIYSEDFDPEEAIESGMMSAREAGFMMGFKRS